ncbi:hypothetical protein BH10PAT1_BH10PAT1_1380 [soil metagenome]
MEEQKPVQPTPVVNPVEPKPKSNLLMIGLGLIILVLLLVSGYLGYQNMQLQKEVTSMKTADKMMVETSPNPVATTDPTNGWKTYTNSDFNFSFKYPTNFEVNDGSNENGLFVTAQVSGIETVPHGSFSVTTDKNSGIDSIINDLYNLSNNGSYKSPTSVSTYTRNQDINIGGIIAHIYTETGNTVADAPIDHSNIILIQRDNKYYVISYWYNDTSNLSNDSVEYGISYQNILNQILSTFKFTQ